MSYLHKHVEKVTEPKDSVSGLGILSGKTGYEKRGEPSAEFEISYFRAKWMEWWAKWLAK